MSVLINKLTTQIYLHIIIINQPIGAQNRRKIIFK
jgi:hypothetical protein